MGTNSTGPGDKARKKKAAQDLATGNPAVNVEEVGKGLEDLSTLRKLGVVRKGYNLASPYGGTRHAVHGGTWSQRS